MHGKILDYNNEMKSGLIRDENERKYHFFIGDCINAEKLQSGVEIEFEPEGERATKVYVIDGGSDGRDRLASRVKSDKEASAKRSKKTLSAVMILLVSLGIGALAVVLVISEMEQRKLDKLQDMYDSQIRNIEKYISKANCADAAAEYARADATRNEISKQGGYYSFEKHEVQAHAIDIAECFAKERDFMNAVGMLDIEKVNDVDYLKRASKIYKKAGDQYKAQEAASKAEKYVPIR